MLDDNAHTQDNDFQGHSSSHFQGHPSSQLLKYGYKVLPQHHSKYSELKGKYPEYTTPLGTIDPIMCGVCGVINYHSCYLRGCTGIQCPVRFVSFEDRADLSNDLSYSEAFQLVEEQCPSDATMFQSKGRQLTGEFSGYDVNPLTMNQTEPFPCSICGELYWNPSHCLCTWAPKQDPRRSAVQVKTEPRPG